MRWRARAGALRARAPPYAAAQLALAGREVSKRRRRAKAPIKAQKESEDRGKPREWAAWKVS